MGSSISSLKSLSFIAVASVSLLMTGCGGGGGGGASSGGADTDIAANPDDGNNGDPGNGNTGNGDSSVPEVRTLTFTGDSTPAALNSDNSSAIAEQVAEFLYLQSLSDHYYQHSQIIYDPEIVSMTAFVNNLDYLPFIEQAVFLGLAPSVSSPSSAIDSQYSDNQSGDCGGTVQITADYQHSAPEAAGIDRVELDTDTGVVFTGFCDDSVFFDGSGNVVYSDHSYTDNGVMPAYNDRVRSAEFSGDFTIDDNGDQARLRVEGESHVSTVSGSTAGRDVRYRNRRVVNEQVIAGNHLLESTVFFDSDDSAQTDILYSAGGQVYRWQQGAVDLSDFGRVAYAVERSVQRCLDEPGLRSGQFTMTGSGDTWRVTVNGCNDYSLELVPAVR